MQKILNNPSRVVDEMLQGFVKCQGDRVVKTGDPRVFRRKDAAEGRRVGVVSGGGTGHYPAFVGYLKPYMLDVAAAGEIFKAPPAETFYHAFKEADQGMGVICIHGNYPLDNEGVAGAIEMAAADGIRVRRIVVNEDAATIPRDGSRENSRGLAGEVLLWKIAGTAAAEGKSLDEITELCQKANDATRSIGVALSACIIPEVGTPNFDVIEGTMEFGIGHHGDPGLSTYKLRPAKQIAELILGELLRTGFSAGDSCAVLVSGLGSTTQMELFILYNSLADILKNRDINVKLCYVGNYFTSLDMQGASVTLMKLDDETERLIRAHDDICLL